MFVFYYFYYCENAVSQKYFDAKGIDMSKAAFEINGYSCCVVLTEIQLVFFFHKRLRPYENS